MRVRNKSIIVAAALAAIPVAANAVTITYTYDPSDFGIGTTKNGPFTTIDPSLITTNGSTVTINLPAADTGDFVSFGVDGQLSNLTSGTATTVDATPTINPTSGLPETTTDSVTGLAQFSFGIGDSNDTSAYIAAGKTVLPPSSTSLTGVVINGSFPSATSNGQADGAGGVSTTAAVTGTIALPPAYPGTTYKLGVTAPQNLASTIVAGIDGPSGTSATFSILPYNAGTQYLAYTKGTAIGTSSSKYQADTLGVGDTAGTTPKLVINIGSSSVTTHQPIISLVGSPTTLTTYGSQDGSLGLTGKGSGSYNVATDSSFTTATTAFVVVSGFNPSTDTEIYALKLALNGTTLLPTDTRLATIVADINNGNTSSGVVASLVSGSQTYSNIFPGYDVLLTATGVAQPAELGFDFSSGTDTDTALGAVTVTGIAAVPEPATAATVVLGAAGLLLGRRRNKAILA